MNCSRANTTSLCWCWEVLLTAAQFSATDWCSEVPYFWLHGSQKFYGSLTDIFCWLVWFLHCSFFWIGFAKSRNVKSRNCPNDPMKHVNSCSSGDKRNCLNNHFIVRGIGVCVVRMCVGRVRCIMFSLGPAWEHILYISLSTLPSQNAFTYIMAM